MSRANCRHSQRVGSEREMITSLISIMLHLFVTNPEETTTGNEQASCDMIITNIKSDRPGGARQIAAGIVEDPCELAGFLTLHCKRIHNPTDPYDSVKLDDWLRWLPSLARRERNYLCLGGMRLSRSEVEKLFQPRICKKLAFADDDISDTNSWADVEDLEELLSYRFNPAEIEELRSHFDELSWQEEVPSLTASETKFQIEECSLLLAQQIERLREVSANRKRNVFCRDENAWMTAVLTKKDGCLYSRVTDTTWEDYLANRQRLSASLNAIIPQVATKPLRLKASHIPYRSKREEVKIPSNLTR